MGASSLDPSFEALVQRLAVIPLYEEKGYPGFTRTLTHYKAQDLACLRDRTDCDQSTQKEYVAFREMSIF